MACWFEAIFASTLILYGHGARVRQKKSWALEPASECGRAIAEAFAEADFIMTWDPLLGEEKNLELIHNSRLFKKGGKFGNADRKWGDLISKNYTKYELDRLAALGRFDYAKQISAGQLGMCDFTFEGLKLLAHSARLLSDLQAGAGVVKSCAGLPITHVQAAYVEQLEASCYGSCLQAISESLSGCEPSRFQKEKPFEDIVESNSQCAKLPFDTLEALAEHVMSEQCHIFHAPSPLWDFNDKDRDSFTQLSSEATCAVSRNRPTWSKSSHQTDYCPQGTQCDCGASNEIALWESTKDLRKFGGKLFVKEGIASGPSMRKQYRNSFLMGVTVASLKAGSLAGGLAAVAHAPMFLVGGTLMLGVRAAIATAKFDCQKILGCWPLRVMRDTAGNCRMTPPASNRGASPLWFLPPPLTRVSQDALRCTLNPCTKEDLNLQRIGVGVGTDTSKFRGNTANIYNCQPLNYEDMTFQQQSLLLQSLQTSGTSKEYAAEVENAQNVLNAGS